jgi:hypothetical protein
MTRLRGHFDGQAVVLDDPVPPGLGPNTPVEVVILEDRRGEELRALKDFLQALWAHPAAPGGPPGGGRWRREELYERGGQRLD